MNARRIICTVAVAVALAAAPVSAITADAAPKPGTACQHNSQPKKCTPTTPPVVLNPVIERPYVSVDYPSPFNGGQGTYSFGQLNITGLAPGETYTVNVTNQLGQNTFSLVADATGSVYPADPTAFYHRCGTGPVVISVVISVVDSAGTLLTSLTLNETDTQTVDGQTFAYCLQPA
jgi:hypothetical protein